jgi:hypothetical protein
VTAAASGNVHKSLIFYLKELNICCLARNN